MGRCAARCGLAASGTACAVHGFVLSEEERMLKVVICMRYFHLFCFRVPSISYLVAKAENGVQCRGCSGFR